LRETAAVLTLSERARRYEEVLSFAALALAAASPAISTDVLSTAPWWERITITYGDDGSQRSCNYESSRSFGGAEACGSDDDQSAAKAPATRAAGVQTRITFERRFTPGATPNAQSLEPGDALLGGLLMMVAIGRDGAVRGCSVVAETGEARPDYGCNEVRAERFQASVGGAAQDSQVGILTVLVYGHEEEVV
jgi:hypothetical protein